jgi:hypothetical protein
VNTIEISSNEQEHGTQTRFGVKRMSKTSI